jgi:hypothetical protein
MLNLKTKFILIAVLSLLVNPAFGSVAPIAMPSASGPLGFKDWKISRIAEARSNLEKLQIELDPNLPTAQAKAQVQAAKVPGRVQKVVRADSRITQAQTNLEIAQELSAHDYFVLYLSQLKSEADIQEAAKKLDPSEFAEIMIGIKKQLSSEAPSEAIPLSSPTPGQKTSRFP